MVANVSTGGIHRTYFDKRDNRLTGNTKMMLGPCAGGAVRLSEGPGPLVVVEGIETGLSLISGLLRSPMTVWATLSTSGMKALKLPFELGELIVATDGDAPGREAGNKLAHRASRLGWRVSLMPAPDGQDWNDVLRDEERP
ncbi:toprim domain-containing protein [Falsihalocynthiibacter sp. CO-5D18]|uniref:toprim domain-containing protein n=1 Tax=Falsihalocynthiibacter sp. CO-5D18 TaxID=3240872 RepID=UPI00350F75E0